MKKILKACPYLGSLMLCLAFTVPMTQAAILDSDLVEQIEWSSDNTANSFDSNTNSSSMAQIIADVIAVFLGLLGIIFVILIIVAGYNWMTAAGNEDKVEKAQHLISRATIGLIIILAAYAITYWIFARMPSGSVN